MNSENSTKAEAESIPESQEAPGTSPIPGPAVYISLLLLKTEGIIKINPLGSMEKTLVTRTPGVLMDGLSGRIARGFYNLHS